MGCGATCGCADCAGKNAAPSGCGAPAAAAGPESGHGGLSREAARALALEPAPRAAPDRARWIAGTGVRIPASGRPLPTALRNAESARRMERNLAPWLGRSLPEIAAQLRRDRLGLGLLRPAAPPAARRTRAGGSACVGEAVPAPRPELTLPRHPGKVEVIGAGPRVGLPLPRHPGEIGAIPAGSLPERFLPITAEPSLSHTVEPDPSERPDALDCPPLPRQVSLGPASGAVGSYLEWGEACGINLGPNPTFGPFLSPADDHMLRVLTPAERRFLRESPPDESTDEVLEALVPELSGRFATHGREFSRRDAIGCILLNPTNFPHEGLFFQGAPGALFFEPVALALRMVFAFAEYLDHEPFFAQRCLYSAEEAAGDRRMADLYREKLGSGAWSVRLFDDASPGCTERGSFDWPVFQMVDPWRVSFQSRNWVQTTAWTPLRTAYLCPPYSGQCLLADYYLFWARRLLHLVAHGQSSNILDFVLARLCARCALAEIAQLAELLVHEFSHIHGSWLECGVGLGLRGQSCCHLMIEWIFNGLVTAALGIPDAHMPLNSAFSFGFGSIDFSADRWLIESSWRQNFSDRSCGSVSFSPLPFTGDDGNAEFMAIHESLFQAHPVQYFYSYAAQCDGSDSESDTGLRTGSGSAWSVPDADERNCRQLCEDLASASGGRVIFDRCIENC